MADEPENLILQMLRRIDLRLERVEEKTADLIKRTISVEDQVVGLRKDFVRLEHRLDNFDVRFDRIEKRLDLVSAD